MRVLCDNNVAQSTRTPFAAATDWSSPRAVRNSQPEATDPEIIAYAEEHEWVILTGDKRFLIDDEDETSSGDRVEADCGVIYYGQDHDPSAGEVVEALETIAENAENCRAIETYVP